MRPCRSLQEARDDAERTATASNFYDLVVLDQVSEFAKEELAHQDTGRIWVREGLVYFPARESDTHFLSVQAVSDGSKASLEDLTYLQVWGLPVGSLE